MPDQIPDDEDRFAAARAWNEKVYAAKEQLRAERRAMSWSEKIRLIERVRKDLVKFKRPKDYDPQGSAGAE